MSGWRRPAEVLVAALALAALALPQDPAAEATAYLGEGRYGEALRAAERVADPRARAEWRFHVLSTGGDLPGALEAARAGLEEHPDHAWLLENAAHTAVTLGLGREAEGLAQRFAALEDLDPDAAERARDLLARAAETRALEDRGRAGVRRARTLALVVIGGALVGLVVLGRGR